MGMDQYVYAFPPRFITEYDSNLGLPDNGLENFEIMYYRNWRYLNYLMSAFNSSRDGPADFNHVLLRISIDDAKRIRDMVNKSMPFPNKKELQMSKRLCILTRKWSEAGYEIYYSASW